MRTRDENFLVLMWLLLRKRTPNRNLPSAPVHPPLYRVRGCASIWRVAAGCRV